MSEPTLITCGKDAHNALIADLAKQPGVRIGRFWEAMRKLPDAEYFTGLLADDRRWAANIKFTPDAYAIDVEGRNIALFEAVATHDITPEKLARIVDFAFALDNDYWTVGLFRCDLSGRRVYDPMAIYVTEMRDRLDHPEAAEQVKLHTFWRRYTVEYCSARFLEALPDEIARLHASATGGGE